MDLWPHAAVVSSFNFIARSSDGRLPKDNRRESSFFNDPDFVGEEVAVFFARQPTSVSFTQLGHWSASLARPGSACGSSRTVKKHLRGLP